MQSNQIVKAAVNTAQRRHADDDVFLKHKAILQNQLLRPSSTSFGHSPGTRHLAPAPSSHFSLPSRIIDSQPQRSSFPHPYSFPSQSVDAPRHMNEDPWRLPSNARREDTQHVAWIRGRNPLPGSHTVTDGMYMRETSQTFVCQFVHVHVVYLWALCCISWLCFSLFG